MAEGSEESVYMLGELSTFRMSDKWANVVARVGRRAVPMDIEPSKKGNKIPRITEGFRPQRIVLVVQIYSITSIFGVSRTCEDDSDERRCRH